MALSRKRERELKQLKAQAEHLWGGQKELLEHANRVVREASRQAAQYARDEVSPRVREAFDDRVKPAVATGVSATRAVAHSTRERFADDVLPAVSSALGSALAVLDVAKDPNLRAAIRKVSSASRSAAANKGLVKARPSAGPGRYILLGIGVVALAGIAYAAWQTLRADDDLWIDDDEIAEQADGIQPS